MKSRLKRYVAYCIEHLRDGEEECAKIFDTREEALKWIEKLSNGFCGDNCDFALFELGKQIDIEERVEETPQPPVKRKHYS